MTDRPWCPSCREAKYFADPGEPCDDCESELQAEWPLRARVRKRLGEAVGIVGAAILFFGPPAYAIRVLLSDAPLYATRTVTVTSTTVYGVLPRVVPVLLLWVLMLFIGWGVATGAFPRP